MAPKCRDEPRKLDAIEIGSGKCDAESVSHWPETINKILNDLFLFLYRIKSLLELKLDILIIEKRSFWHNKRNGQIIHLEEIELLCDVVKLNVLINKILCPPLYFEELAIINVGSR